MFEHTSSTNFIPGEGHSGFGTSTRLPWMTHLPLSDDTIMGLHLLEARQAKTNYTEVIHITPTQGKSRIGFFLDKKSLKDTWKRCNASWYNLRPFERSLALENLERNLDDLLPHVRERLERFACERTRFVPAEVRYLLSLCRPARFDDNALKNPFEITHELHPLLGARVVSVEDSKSSLLLNAAAHFDNDYQVSVMEHIANRAIEPYEGKFRKNGRDGRNGEPFVTHPFEVTEILIKVGVYDREILSGSVYHDLEDADISLDSRPIQRTWLRAVENHLKATYPNLFSPTELSRIAKYIYLSSKPELMPNGDPIPEGVDPKRIMHLNANTLHASRVIKAADHIHGILTADTLSHHSRGKMIPRAPELIIPFLGVPSPEEADFTNRQRIIEERLRSILICLRPQLLKLVAERMHQ